MGAQGRPYLQLNPQGSWTGGLVAEEETQRVSYLIPTCHLQLNEKNLGPVIIQTLCILPTPSQKPLIACKKQGSGWLKL